MNVSRKVEGDLRSFLTFLFGQMNMIISTRAKSRPIRWYFFFFLVERGGREKEEEKLDWHVGALVGKKRRRTGDKKSKIPSKFEHFIPNRGVHFLNIDSNSPLGTHLYARGSRCKK